MKAALIITGAEILSGYRQDALVQPLSRMLDAAGFKVSEIRMTGDDSRILLKHLHELKKENALILVTGGLGQTPDDTTHSVIDTLTTDTAKIAYIDNPTGLEKGIVIETETSRIVFMPGVPKETLCMAEQWIKTMQGSSTKGSGRVNIGVFGLSETDIASRLDDLAPECSFLPKDMETTLSVPRKIEGQIRNILGHYAMEEETIISTITALLMQRGLHIACAESCTGGLIGHLLSDTPGSSAYFMGSVVSYANSIKTGVLGVDQRNIEQHGAVSQEVSTAMLSGVLKLTHADVGVATTGIAGPSGGTPEKPVGTIWITVGSKTSQESRCLHFGFGRQANKMLGAKAALFMLRSFIHDKDIHSHTPA